jgi:hypothetical protein
MTISIPIISEFNGSGIAKAKAEFKQLETVGQKAQFAIRKAAVPAGLALGALGGFMVKAAKGAEEARIANDKLGSVLDTMGFGEATDRVSAYAESLEKTVAVDADVIKATQTKLATFGELTKTVGKAGGAFDRATMAALDMAAAGFGTAEGNAVQLGKALQDPIKGLAALAKSGVTFTDQEKEKIKTLVESGKQLEAQEMILKAIEGQVKGTAESSASSFDKMKFAIAGVSDTFGDMLLPVIDALAPKLAAFSAWAQENPTALKIVAASIAGVAAAITLVSIAMALNPFGLIAIAVAGLVTGIVIAYTQFKTFAKVVRTVINGVIGYFETVANAWVTVINTLIRGYNLIPGLPDISLVGNVSLGRMRSGGPETDGLSDSRITALATGGIVTAPQIALIGEAGPEAVIPLDRMGDFGMGGGGMNITVNAGLVSSPEQVGQQIIEAIQKAQRRSGPVFAPA